jgi:cobalt-zinc-cadmium efflux system outer membrane protein
MKPQPLDLGAAHAALQARDLNAERVIDYAKALASASAGQSQVFDPSDGISLLEGQAIALWYNPELRIARLQLEQVEAVAATAGRWSDPELGLEGGEKAVESEATGLLRDASKVSRSWISAASLSITIPLSGRTRAEKQLRITESETAALRVAEAEWKTLTEVRDAWTQWSATRERVQLLAAHLGVLGEFSGAASALAEVGEIPPSSARLFTIEVLRKQAERDREQAAEREARVALLQLLGLLPEAPVEFLPEINVDAPVPPQPATPELHPAIARVKSEYQAAENRLRLELRKQYPDLTLSPTFTDEQDETSLVLGLGIPVPVWNANRAGIAEAAAARDIARAQAEAAYQQLLSESAQAEAALSGSRALRARLVEGVVPIIDTQMTETIALLKVGEIDIVLVYEALTQALETKQEILEAAVAEAHAASRYAAATASSPITTDTRVETEK